MASTRQTRRPAYVSGGERMDTTPAIGSTLARYVGALALLAMAAIHLEQYANADYYDIPTIGTLFLLNFIGGTALAVGLMSPLERLANGRFRPLVVLLALAGAAMAAVSIAFLLISEGTTLFGFHESGYRPAIVLVLVFEGIAVLFLGGFAAARLRSER
jgi:hypothetical protein